MARTWGRRVARWLELAVVHGEGDLEGEPFVVRPDQQDFLDRWYAIDDDGRWIHDRAYLELPKGEGKTMLLAALAIEHLLGPTRRVLGKRRPNVVVAANAVRQAGVKRGGKHRDDPEDWGDGIFGRIGQILTHENCPLSDAVKVFGDRITLRDEPGAIRVIPSRASTVDGGLPTLYVADEVQDWTGSAAEAFDRVGNSTTKSTGGRVLAASTPGAYVGAPSVGWRLRHYADRLDSGEIDDPHFLWHHSEASDHWDLTDPEQRAQAILEASPSLTPDSPRLDRLVRRYDEIPNPDYRRFHLSQWVQASDDTWLSRHPGAWDRCTAPDLEPQGETWIGIDVSLRNDMTAVSWTSPVEGRWPTRTRVFEPSAASGVVDHVSVMQFVRSLFDRPDLDVKAAGYDPRFWEVPAQMLLDEGYLMIEMPQTTTRMIPACGHALQLITQGQVAHDGDPIFAQHVHAAAKREYDNGWTLSKAKSGRHIDALIASIIAWWMPHAVTLPDPEEDITPTVGGEFDQDHLTEIEAQLAKEIADAERSLTR